MDAYKTTHPEYRHAPIVRYGRFRIDRTWFRFEPSDAREGMYELVCEIDESSAFDLISSLILGQVYTRIAAGEVVPASEVRRVVSRWLDRMRPTPGGGEVALACYRRRVGPVDGDPDATLGEWFLDAQYRRLGRPLMDMREAVPLVEAALRELEETNTNTAE